MVVCFLVVFLCHMSVSDLIKKIAVILLNGGLIWYLITLLLGWQMIVQSEYASSNLATVIILIVTSVYVFINYSIQQFHVTWSRTTLSVLWLFLLVIWHYILANNAEAGIYIGDIVKVLWVVFFIAWPAKLFVSKKIEQKAKEAKMEVIEV